MRSATVQPTGKRLALAALQVKVSMVFSGISVESQVPVVLTHR